MAVFNVTAFQAEAEIMGKIRQVQYRADESLVIHGVGLAEAKKAIDLLSTGLQVVTFDEEKHGPAPDPKPETEPVAETTPEPAPTASKRKPKPTGKKKEAAKPEPELAPDEPPEKSNVVDLETAKKQEGAGGDDQEELVAKLSKFTKLIDVVEVLREAGFKEADDIVAQCERAKDQVPVLKKIPNVADRVKRVLERLSA